MKTREIPDALRAGNDETNRIEHNDDAGQATVEFALMIGIVFFLLFMIFQAGVTYMTTQYIKYAAFMGARTYAVQGSEKGKEVIFSYLGPNGEKLKPFIRRVENKEFIEDASRGKEVGFRINYKSLFYFPFIGRGITSTGNEEAKEAPDKKGSLLELSVKSRMKDENLKCNQNKVDNKTGSEDGC